MSLPDAYSARQRLFTLCFLHLKTRLVFAVKLASIRVVVAVAASSTTIAAFGSGAIVHIHLHAA